MGWGTEPLSIAEVFADKFDTLYQSVSTDEEGLDGIKKQLSENIIHEESLNECNIIVNDIDCAIKRNWTKGVMMVIRAFNLII